MQKIKTLVDKQFEMGPSPCWALQFLFNFVPNIRNLTFGHCYEAITVFSLPFAPSFFFSVSLPLSLTLTFMLTFSPTSSPAFSFSQSSPSSLSSPSSFPSPSSFFLLAFFFCYSF